MTKRLMAALVLSTSLMTSACSAQEPAEDTPHPVPATSTVEAAAGFTAPDEAWRDLDPENTLYIDTQHGRMIVELFPEIAPKHVAQIKTLTRQKFYDYITFHRVIDGFMNQTGDPKGDGTGDSSLPDLEAEFSFRRAPSMPVTLIGARPIDPRNPNAGEVGVGFYKGLPIASQPAAGAMATKDGKVSAWGLHCKGVTSMARAQDPNSANSQFFLMRGRSDNLNTAYSIWGNTVWGRETLTKIKEGTVGETDNFTPDRMDKVQVAADVPEAERVPVQVVRTDSPAFKNYLRSLKKDDGTYPDICDVEVPARLKP